MMYKNGHSWVRCAQSHLEANVLKDRLFRIVLIFSAVTVLFIPSACADGCPVRAVPEDGGTHWCYSAGSLGHVHLWKPASYDAASAVTVVYVHGYNLTEDGRQVTGKRAGLDGCVNAHYIDCAWDKHHLAEQFAASGLNALFVAVEGPVNDHQRAKWKSLGSLLSTIGRHGFRVPKDVTAVGHSAGGFTVVNFLNDRRLKHVVALDALYRRVPRRLEKWYRPSQDHRLTLIGAEGLPEQTAAFGAKLGCDVVEDPAEAYSEDAMRARCVVAVDAAINHMVVTDGEIVPIALTRTYAPDP